MVPALTISDRNTLLSAARLALQTFIKTRRLPEIQLNSPRVTGPAGAFVTLRVRGEVRGCVGTLPTGMALYEVIMALAAAAAEDSRYVPVDAEELHLTRIEITVLSPLDELRSPEDIITGQTGIAIRGDQPAILLPEAAAENSWTAEEMLNHLCEMAGLAPGCWRTSIVYRFTTETFGEE